jgi:hypothetical protein
MTGYKDPPKESQFKKNDIRINRRGRPKSFNALRELAKMIANEKIEGKTKDGQSVVMSRVELILRDWATSKGNWQLQKQFMEIAYGKVKDEIELSGPDGKPIEISNLTEDELKKRIAAIIGIDLPAATNTTTPK